MKVVLPQLCVNQRTLPSENLEADATLGQHADGSDKMVEVASHTVESPHNQDVAIPDVADCEYLED